MKLDPQSLRQVVSRTLDHYQARAEAFWEGTRHHDVEQNIEALLRHIEPDPVSYTHLDVYKRQPPEIACGANDRMRDRCRSLVDRLSIACRSSLPVRFFGVWPGRA